MLAKAKRMCYNKGMAQKEIQSLSFEPRDARGNCWKELAGGGDLAVVRPEEVPDLLQVNPVLLVGRHGVGKTRCAQQAAQALGGKLKVFNFTQTPKSAFSALPIVGEQEIAHGISRELQDVLEDKEPTVLFFDELNRAHPDVVATIFSLVEPNGGIRIGEREYKRPENMFILGALNPSDMYSDAAPLAIPAGNRWLVYWYQPTVEDWLEWAAESGIRPEIARFIAQKGEEALTPGFDPNRDGIYPTGSPRNWELVSSAWDKGGVALALRVMAGFFPKDIVQEFEEFLQGETGEHLGASLKAALANGYDWEAVAKIVAAFTGDLVEALREFSNKNPEGYGEIVNLAGSPEALEALENLGEDSAQMVELFSEALEKLASEELANF